MLGLLCSRSVVGLWYKNCQVGESVLNCLYLSVQDVSLVRSLLQRHSRYTGSPKAKALLFDWKTAQAHFVKIFPHEYRRALGEAEKTKVHLACSFTWMSRVQSIISVNVTCSVHLWQYEDAVVRC